MKKILIMLCVAALAMSMLTACGKSANNEGANSSGAGNSGESAEAVDVTQLKTMGDIFALVGKGVDSEHNPENYNEQEAYSETVYVFVFTLNEVSYRVKLDLPEDVSAKLWELDFDDPERDQKIFELLGPLEPTSVENLNEMIPTQEELDQWIGKTGADMFEAGWTYNYYNLEEVEAGMSDGVCEYKVLFEYEGEPMQNTDDFDFYAQFENLKIASITFERIGDAANP